MERESFEDEQIAKLMNDVFIPIKVDREERPDIDAIYMAACQMMTGSGGWPLTVIMTPDKKPFFTGTYFPKESQMGRIGMLELIPKVQQVWAEQREDALDSANRVAEVLASASAIEPGSALSEATSNTAFGQFASTFDGAHGGFRNAPKFPSPHNLIFLLRYWSRTGEARALEMVEKTLVAMRLGGIFDQIGFGFHRYSTDREWLLPHFEKMLYDQAMLVLAYTEAYQATRNDAFRKTAEEILKYVLRDMTSPDGGFYSAEDADSEGEEGKFYVWHLSELIGILGEEDAELICRIYNVRSEGNFVDEATRQKTGANILHLKSSSAEISDELGIEERELLSRIDSARERLFEVRESRVHPYKDDKVLADWNGLMIAALAKAGRVFGESRYLDATNSSLEFLLGKMRAADGVLLHRYREGEAAIPGFLDDYAFLTWGALELYESTFEMRFLELALDWTEFTLAHFWDERDGGFHFSSSPNEELLVRKKEIYDGAIPSGNSVAMLNLLRLARITGNHELERRAVELGRAFSRPVGQAPAAHAQLLSAVEYSLGKSVEVVVLGDRGGADTETMLAALQERYLPNLTLVFVATDAQAEVAQLMPLLEDFKMIDGKATAYVCRDFACDLPTTNVDDMLSKIDGYLSS